MKNEGTNPLCCCPDLQSYRLRSACLAACFARPPADWNSCGARLKLCTRNYFTPPWPSDDTASRPGISSRTSTAACKSGSQFLGCQPFGSIVKLDQSHMTDRQSEENLNKTRGGWIHSVIWHWAEGGVAVAAKPCGSKWQQAAPGSCPRKQVFVNHCPSVYSP